MRLIRRLLLLAVIGAGAVVALNHWSDGDWQLRPRAAALDAETATRHAVRLAHKAAAKAHDAASKFGGSFGEGPLLTAKIKSKMALDDHIKARAIDIDTSGTTVTLTGVVASADERDRALHLARETDGVTRVVDKLRVSR
jgi:hypothetical protein